MLRGTELRCLVGAPAAHVSLVACRARCEPIPWQLDERGPDGRLSLENGPFPNPDEPPGVIDSNDEIRWMVEDSGRRILPQETPRGAACGVEVRLAERETGYQGWIYAFASPSPAPRAKNSYVRYDPRRDVITGQRVALGFGGATPQYLALTAPDGTERKNLIDRLKVRASAWFLGVIPIHRDESDLTTEFVAWHGGPIRVVRRQRQWVRVGFGIRSPTFGSYTYFYRDAAELPVSLHLNFPPTYFFRRIRIRAVLDFRDLRDWEVVAAALEEPLAIGSMGRREEKRLDGMASDWFALVGPDVTLVELLGVSPSLATVKRSLLYRDDATPRPPEAIPGEAPGIGYLLSDWGQVGGGRHWFSSTSIALPAGYDPREFLRERRRRIVLRAREMRIAGEGRSSGDEHAARRAHPAF